MRDTSTHLQLGRAFDMAPLLHLFSFFFPLLYLLWSDMHLGGVESGCIEYMTPRFEMRKVLITNVPKVTLRDLMSMTSISM